MFAKKLLLRVSEKNWMICIGYICYSILTKLLGEARADLALAIGARTLFSSPGLTFERYGYYHPYTYEFIYNVQERYRVRKLKMIPTEKLERLEVKDGRRIKVGFFGSLATPNKDLFIQRPENVELYVYDNQQVNGIRSQWLETCTDKYYCFNRMGKVNEKIEKGYLPINHKVESRTKELSLLVKQINSDELDVLINIGGISKDWDLLVNRANSRKILNYATGSIISFNPKVDMDIFMQPQKYYTVKGRGVYCDLLEKYFNNIKLKEFAYVFNHRDIDIDENLPLEERKKRIVYHGNLYKLYNKAVLDLIKELLKRDQDFEFVFFGANQKNYLKKTLAFFEKSGVSKQVKYLGVFSNAANPQGLYDSESWKEMCKVIRESRLYVDPWPICGGNTVYQAYMLGVPCVSMKLRKTEDIKKMSKEETLVEVSGLEAMGNFVKTQEEFKELCVRILEDEIFSKKLIEAQYRCAKKLSGDEAYKEFWEMITS